MPGIINEKINAIIDDSGATSCVECGKCVAVCPMSAMYPDFGWEMSPRGLIRRTLMGDDMLRDPMIWRCTECNAGTDVCPAGVSCRDLIRGLRQLAVETGVAEPARKCVHCGETFVPLPVDDYVQGRLSHSAGNHLNTCPACRQHRYALRNA